MECPLCGHAETLVYGKTDKGELQRICPACHEIFADRPHYTAPWINLLRFRDRPQPEIKSPETKSVSWSDLFVDAGVVISFTIAQCGWMSVFTSPKVGLINVLPTFIFLATWYLFVKTQLNQKLFSIDLQKYAWLVFGLGFVLTLRLPLTISRNLELVNWGIYSIVFGLILSSIVSYFRQERKLGILIAAITIILFNSFTHISLNSPFTYSFRMVLAQPSHHVSGQDNNATWECPYDFTDASTEVVVHCDMRHFIASEKIFTLPKYDASFAVFLKRFFYGYLSSLIGFEGHRWIASFSLNIIFWILTCAAVFRICILTKLDRINQNISSIATLCGATSWGFVSLVAQPSPYLLAYALTAFMLWIALEIISSDDRIDRNLNLRQLALFTIVMFAAPLTYELYPVALACILLLLIYRKFTIAAVIVSGQIILPLLWSKVFLQKILGTIGVQEGVMQNIPMSVKAWLNILTQFDLNQAANFIAKGSLSFLYSGMIFGTLASISFIVYLLIQLNSNPDPEIIQNQKTLLAASSIFCLLFLLAGIFIAPTAQYWSPTGMVPRFLYYTYVINTVALASIACLTLKKYAYIVPVLTFVVANVSLFGIASVTYFSDYGQIGLYWK